MGDRLGLHFGEPSAGEGAEAAELLLVVEEHMPELVGERLRSLGLGEVWANRDAPTKEVRLAVGRRAVSSEEREALRSHLFGEPVPQRRGCHAFEQARQDLGKVWAVGLGDVEHVDDAKAAQHSGESGTLLLVGLVDATTSRHARCEDRDPPLALLHLVTECLPRSISAKAGRIGPLAENQQNVPGAVVVEPACDVEHLHPVLAGDEGFDRFDHALVRLGQLVVRWCRHRVLLSVRRLSKASPCWPKRTPARAAAGSRDGRARARTGAQRRLAATLDAGVGRATRRVPR